MNQPRATTPELERFARETLGCRCPDAVFQHIADGPCTLPGWSAPARRIDYGGRLLVYLVAVTDPLAAAARIADWVRAGVAERDGLGMNRLRLVIASDGLAPDTLTAIESAFAQAPGQDERVHLHLIPAAAVPHR